MTSEVCATTNHVAANRHEPDMVPDVNTARGNARPPDDRAADLQSRHVAKAARFAGCPTIATDQTALNGNYPRIARRLNSPAVYTGPAADVAANGRAGQLAADRQLAGINTVAAGHVALNGREASIALGEHSAGELAGPTRQGAANLQASQLPVRAHRTRLDPCPANHAALDGYESHVAESK